MLLTGFVPAQAASDVVFRNGFDSGFQIQTPEMTVAPGEETTYCYYFRAPNAGATGVRRWSSLMQPGMPRLILFAAHDGNWQPLELQPPETLTQASCGMGIGSNNTAWIYAAHDPVSELAFPTDDGNDSPLVAELQPNQPIYLQMRVSNPGVAPLTTSALLEAESLGSDTAYTKSASYLTVNTNIHVPPLTNATVTATCAVPSNVRFWWLSTRTHRFATLAEIADAASGLVVSHDWAHPAIAQFAAPGFYSFSPSGMTYRCTYGNPTPSPISFGESETSDETCMGIGYFFPAVHSATCVNSTGPL